MGSVVKSPSGKFMKTKGSTSKKPSYKDRIQERYEDTFSEVGGLEEAKKLGYVEREATLQSPDILGTRRRREAQEWVERYNSPEEKSKRASQAEANTQGEARGEAEVVSSDSRETNSDGLGIEGDVGSPRKKKKQIARSGLGI